MKLYDLLEDVLTELGAKQKGNLTEDEFINILKQHSSESVPSASDRGKWLFYASYAKGSEEKKFDKAYVKMNDEMTIFKFVSSEGSDSFVVKTLDVPKKSLFVKNEDPKYINISTVLKNGARLQFTGRMLQSKE